jgi:hypothetical protein
MAEQAVTETGPPRKVRRVSAATTTSGTSFGDAGIELRSGRSLGVPGAVAGECVEEGACISSCPPLSGLSLTSTGRRSSAVSPTRGILGPRRHFDGSPCVGKPRCSRSVCMNRASRNVNLQRLETTPVMSVDARPRPVRLSGRKHVADAANTEMHNGRKRRMV